MMKLILPPWSAIKSFPIIGRMAASVKGNFAQGFEPVKEAFEKLLNSGCEDKLQLCVYVNNQCVVDLYGSYRPDDSYTSDTIQCIFSSGKPVTSIIIAQLVEQGLLDYDEKVSKYWPEFGSKGKENVTLADVMRHESGLAWFNHTFQQEDFFTENIKKNIPGEIIANERLHLPEVGGIGNVPTKREYHAITRGCILNEVVRRVDPQGRTIGELLKDNSIFDGIYLGLSEDQFQICADDKGLSNQKIFLQSLILKSMGRGIEPSFVNLLQMINKAKKVAGKLKIAERPAFMRGVPRSFAKMDKVVNEPFFRKCQVPSANFHASAKSLGKLAAIMANQGQPLNENGQGLMSEETWNLMHANEKRAFDAAMHNNRTNFTQGGLNVYTIDKESTKDEKIVAEKRQGFVGWAGLGGSVFQWHPELKIGFAFVPTCLHWFDVPNLRGARLQQIVVDCIKSKK